MPVAHRRILAPRARVAKGPRLVAIGDLMLDVVVRPERPVERGTDVPGSIAFRRGGSAANTCAVFAHEGGDATLVTSLGQDGWTRQLVASLRADGVRVHAVRSDAVAGRLVALVDARGERSFVTQRGAADRLAPADVKPAWVQAADVLHVPAYSLFAEPIGSASLEAVRLAREAGAIVSTDLSSRRPMESFGVRRSRSRLRALRPDVLFATRDEAATLLRRPGMRAWSGLLALAPLAVVKDGVSGCRVLSRRPGSDADLELDVAARRIRRVDSTGAGDAFAAGFLLSLVLAQVAGGRDATPDGWSAAALRRAALAGHRSAAAALERPRPEIALT